MKQGVVQVAEQYVEWGRIGKWIFWESSTDKTGIEEMGMKGFWEV